MLTPDNPRWLTGHKQQGFTLLEMSIVLAILATVIGGAIVIFNASVQTQEAALTQTRQQAIQTALYNFRVANIRLPCPADVTQAIDISTANSNYFGVESANPGSCMGGTPAANFYTPALTLTGTTTSASSAITGMSSTVSSTLGSLIGFAVTGTGIPAGAYIISVDSPTQLSISGNATASGSTTLTLYNVVQGMVPTKALRLPDDYAFDGWGNRMMYTVDVRYTEANAFANIADNNGPIGMTVLDASYGTKSTGAVYVLLSYGPDGQGAYPRGSTTTNLNITTSRINSGSVNAAELQNCNCTGR